MSKYFELDKNRGEDSHSSKFMGFALMLAGIVITLILISRFFWYVPLNLDHYGSPRAKYKQSFTIAGTSKTKGYDSKSPVGHCIKALKVVGVKEYKSIEYISYEGSVDIGERLTGGKKWGIHKFLIKEYNGLKGDNRYVAVAFLSGYDRMDPGYYSTRIYRLEKA